MWGNYGVIENHHVILYNRNVDDLLTLLSGAQITRLCKLLRLVMRIGHGSVYIRAKNGKLRFIGLADLEEEFTLDKDASLMENLLVK